MNSYWIGTVVRLASIYAADGAALNPTVTKLTIRTPRGVETTYTYGTDAALVRDSTGNFHFDLAVTEPGVYWARWWSTGTGAAAEITGVIARAQSVSW